MTYTKSNIIQYNEYYPFGLQTANSWTRENQTGNNFLYNGGTELNTDACGQHPDIRSEADRQDTTTNVYDLFFRNSKAFKFLKDEEDLYSISDLKERYK